MIPILAWKDMKSSIILFHWLPRIIGIAAILFISLFAADAFEPGQTFWQQFNAFLIHLVPSFILTFMLLVAWKWEFVGGILFMLIGLIMTPIVFTINYELNDSFWMSLGIILSITAPFIVVGVLFIISHFLKKKRNLK